MFYVESRLDETAKSKVGAIGIAQIMPGTEQEIRQSEPMIGDVKHARHGIKAGAYYMNKKIQTWRGRNRGYKCLYELSWASYNAGTRNIINAQGHSRNNKCWSGISPYLVKVTGDHAVETIGYVNLSLIHI